MLDTASCGVYDPESSLIMAIMIETFYQVVAVLLDNFVAATANWKRRTKEQDEEQRMEQAGISKAEMESPLAPLLENLCRFANKVYTYRLSQDSNSVLIVCNQGDLDNRIKSLYYVCHPRLFERVLDEY